MIKGAATAKTGGKIDAEYTKLGGKSGIAIEARADDLSKKRRREADAFVDDFPSFCSMLCIFTRHGRREKEEADDEGS